MESGKKKLGLSFNAPAVLVFTAACVAVQLISMLTGGASNRLLFSVYRSSFADPLAYLRSVGHVLGHADWNHLINNMMYILILGPMIEEKYGTANTVLVIVATALITGIVNVLLFPNPLLGASGVVFAFIMMASITTVKEDRKIPITFILVALLYIGQQVYQGITQQDNVSQLTHIIGGVVGSVFAFVMQKTGTTRS